MKTSIIIVIIFGLLAAGCSTTTYVNLSEKNRRYIERQLDNAEKDKEVGAEVSMLLKDGTEIYGELLSIRDSTMTLCTEYSATEKELAKLKYPITTIRNDEIKELTIEGSNYIWIGLGIGIAACLLGAALSEAVIEKGDRTGSIVYALVFGALPIAGSIVGYALSTDDVILQEIPPDYNLSLFKPLARYPDEEPEYLRAIE